ncbi:MULTISPECIES: hypothetical protein [unclassified Pseudomonas]|uniref:hypothetical protein n=1 Tax=unclassified Pseudomonas TaxID=196821 RepID=UPI00046F0264|nr:MULTISPECIES: hypothetical protein [unclassified Pseudomonas]
MQKLLMLTESQRQRVKSRSGLAGIPGAFCLVSPPDETARLGQMSGCFLDFLATATHAPAWAMKPEAMMAWLDMDMGESPLRGLGWIMVERHAGCQPSTLLQRRKARSRLSAEA